MESKYDDIIVELQKLGGIQRNGRICKSRQGGITFEHDTFWTPVKRFWNGDSRYQGVHDISLTLKKAFEETRLMLNSKYLCTPKNTIGVGIGVAGGSDTGMDDQPPAASSSEDDEHRQLLERLYIMYTGLEKAIDGMENICETYKEDKETVTQLQYMADKIRRRLGDIELKCPSVVTHDHKNFTVDD